MSFLLKHLFSIIICSKVSFEIFKRDNNDEQSLSSKRLIPNHNFNANIHIANLHDYCQSHSVKCNFTKKIISLKL